MKKYTLKLTAYALALFTAVGTAPSMQAFATSVAELMPTAGIGVTLSEGTTLTKIKDQAKYMEAQGAVTMTLSQLRSRLVSMQSPAATRIGRAAAMCKNAKDMPEQTTFLVAEVTSEPEITISDSDTVLASISENVLKNANLFPASGAGALGGGVSTYAVEAKNDPQDEETCERDENLDAAQLKADVVCEIDPEQIIEECETEELGEGDGESEDGSIATASPLALATESPLFGIEAEEEESTEENTEEVDEEDNQEDELPEIADTQTPAEILALEAANMTDEEKEFSKLVIAQVDNYVNVREKPDEESEKVGKLYDKSVGTFEGEEDGWYKINSGSVIGYVKAEYCVTGKEAVELAKQVGTRIATVTTTTLRVREEPNTDAEVIGMVPIEDELTVSAEEDEWVKVNIEEGDGWVSKEFVKLRTDFVKAESKAEEEARLAKEEAARLAAIEAAARQQAKSQKQSSSSKNSNYNAASSYVAAGGGSASGNAVANFALQFVGNPYVYGGTSLTNGADCSGFVMSVYNNFGVSLPHSSAADRSVGSTVGSLAEAQPGDLVCYSGHVALYIGGGQIVHASTSRTGIIVSNAAYRNILSIRRIF